LIDIRRALRSDGNLRTLGSEGDRVGHTTVN
jgi:hypothetical protein